MGPGETWTFLGPIPDLLDQLLCGGLPGDHTVLLLLVAGVPAAPFIL